MFRGTAKHESTVFHIYPDMKQRYDGNAFFTFLAGVTYVVT